MFGIGNKKSVVVNEGIAPTNVAPVFPDMPVSPPANTVQATPAIATAPNLPPIGKTNIGSNFVYRKKPVNWFLFLIPALLIVATMVAITVILPSLRNSNSGVVVENTPTPSLVPETPSPTQKPDPTKTWKVYVNREAQLSFRYPQNISLKEEKPQAGLFAISLSEEASSSGSLLKIYSAQNKPSNELLASVAKVTLEGNEEDTQVSGIVGKKGTGTVNENSVDKKIVFTRLDNENLSLVFVYGNPANIGLFEDILKTVRLVSPGITADWKTYTNTLGNYVISFPPSWSINTSDEKASGSAQTISIRKTPTEAAFQNLVVQVSATTPNKSTDLSASEIISSIQNLSGWKESPALDFRALGGGQAQIISGEKDGAWHQYAVLWYRNTLIEMTWRDTLFRPEQETFDDMLGSFKFTR